MKGFSDIEAREEQVRYSFDTSDGERTALRHIGALRLSCVIFATVLLGIRDAQAASNSLPSFTPFLARRHAQSLTQCTKTFFQAATKLSAYAHALDRGRTAS